MDKRLAVYAGTFDPLTIGHLWMIKQGSHLFDKLIVAVAANPEKRCMFSPEERFAMLKESIGEFPNVSAGSFMDDYTVDYAAALGAHYILRGVRKISDYDYERDMRDENEKLVPYITTVVLMPPLPLIRVSSSFVKGMMTGSRWKEVVKRYVPAPVFKKLKEAHRAKSQ